MAVSSRKTLVDCAGIEDVEIRCGWFYTEMSARWDVNITDMSQVSSRADPAPLSLLCHISSKNAPFWSTYHSLEICSLPSTYYLWNHIPYSQRVIYGQDVPFTVHVFNIIYEEHVHIVKILFMTNLFPIVIILFIGNIFLMINILFIDNMFLINRMFPVVYMFPQVLASTEKKKQL